MVSVVPRPRRPKLGQHFLADARYRRKIFEALDLRPDELVIEIGAGRGAMTELLAERAQRVVAIEIDSSLARELENRLRGDPRIQVLQADILSTDVAELCRRERAARCFVFGNLPYYITSPILDRLFFYSTSIRAMALLVQSEVAERLTASPGRRAYGYLSVLAQLYSQPRVVLHVPPGAFSPPPKVQSVLVEFKTRASLPESLRRMGAHPGAPQQPERFLDFVKRCFAQKRKNLLNNLAEVYQRPRVAQALASLTLAPSLRAEQLSLERLVELYRRLETFGPGKPLP